MWSFAYRFSLAIIFSFHILGVDLSHAKNAIYLNTFDPITHSQLAAINKILEDKTIEKIFLIPKFDSDAIESIDRRLKMLRTLSKSDPRIQVPTAREFASAQSSQTWNAFWQKHAPEDLTFVAIAERREEVAKSYLPDSSEFKIESHAVFSKGDDIPKGIALTEINSEINVSRRFREYPSLNESLVPEPVAHFIQAEKLYGHDGMRGYYALPREVSRQLVFEQTLNDRIEDTSIFASIHDNNLPRKYYPEERPVFKMIVLEVPNSDLRKLATSNFAFSVEAKEGHSYFFIHPHSKSHYAKAIAQYPKGPEYWGTPTSSHRSLIVWDPLSQAYPVGVKSSLNANIGATLRLLSESQIERASATSALINTLDKAALAKEGILFIDEPLGVVLNSTTDGYAIRELPKIASGRELIPMFSLYSKPPGKDTPFVEMIKKSGQDPRAFVYEKVIEPLVRHMNYLAWAEGLVGEPHEQNLMMELENGLPTGRYYYRDLAGFHINLDMRLVVGKNMDFLPAGISRESLKSERANFIVNSQNYLRHSNFFALLRSTKPEFKQINEEFIDDSFRKAMATNIKRMSGVKVDHTIPSWEAAFKLKVSLKTQALQLKQIENLKKANCTELLGFVLNSTFIKSSLLGGS